MYSNYAVYSTFKATNNKWYVQWTRYGIAHVVTDYLPSSEQDAKAYADRMNEIHANKR